MRSWQSWLANWNHRPTVHALVRRLAPLSGSAAFAPLAGALTLAATVTMTLPLVPVVCALVALRPLRWRAIVFWTVMGSATGAVLLTFAFGSLSLAWLDAKMPELMNSAHWKHLTVLGGRHGWWALATVAALPVAETPALVLAAMLGMPLQVVFVAVALGKTCKYALVARATALMSARTAAEHLPQADAHFPNRGGR